MNTITTEQNRTFNNNYYKSQLAGGKLVGYLQLHFSSHGLFPSDLVAQSVEQRWSNPKVEGGCNSHPGQSFSLSLCGPIPTE